MVEFIVIDNDDHLYNTRREVITKRLLIVWFNHHPTYRPKIIK